MTTYAERRDAHNANGLCANCSRQLEPGIKHCPVCAAAHRKCMVTARCRRKERGLCLHCGNAPHRPNRVLCEECARKSAARTAAHNKRKREPQP